MIPFSLPLLLHTFPAGPAHIQLAPRDLSVGVQWSVGRQRHSKI